MNERQVLVVGGGPAGFFAAITSAEASPRTRVTLLEQGPQFLAKVRVSGGGRCNLTHATWDPKELSRHYPRGGAALLGPFHRFQPRDTVAWFEKRGVRLKTEADGRMFPASDSSRTVIDCLLRSARAAGVEVLTGQRVEQVVQRSEGGFKVSLAKGADRVCDRLMLATGGCRAAEAGRLAEALGHTLAPPVPSLFTFRIAAPWLKTLAGVSLELVEVSIPGLRLEQRGPMLITHEGLSGPAILKLSAWGARDLHATSYRFSLLVRWLPQLKADDLAKELQTRRAGQPARRVVNCPLPALPARLWEQLALTAGITPETRWAQLSRSAQHQLIQQLSRTELTVVGTSVNRDEFVTCGGVRLSEVEFRTMESRLCPGLYFGGELLDVDGLTGGFNLQAAWTTGWIAGQAMGADKEITKAPR